MPASSRSASRRTLVNVALVPLVLLPAHVVIASIAYLLFQDEALAGLPARIATQTRRFWYLPLAFLLVAPLVWALVARARRRWTPRAARVVAIVLSSAAFAALMQLLFGRLPNPRATHWLVLSAAISGVVYGAAMRLPDAGRPVPDGTSPD